MNKGLKLAPFALAALMLIGCSPKTIGPENGNNSIVGENGTTYQEFYDELYKTNGADFASKELILRVAKDVVENSETFKAIGVDEESKKLNIVIERQKEVLDSFYTSAYKYNGFFKEELLVESLRNQGYKIPDLEEGQQYYEESDTELVGYAGLSSKLTADYSDYFEQKADYDIYTQLLKEEYILSQKTSYFSNDSKRIRSIQYFAFTPNDANQASLIQEQLEGKLSDSKMSSKDFKTLAETTFQNIVVESEMDKIAKDYAIINYKPESEMTEVEKKYKDLAINIYDGSEYTDAQKTKVKEAMGTYTNSGAYPKEYGYYLKQLEARTNLHYTEKTVTNDNSGSAIASAVDTKLFKTNSESLEKSNFLDFTDRGNKVFKAGEDGTYYVVRYNIIDDELLKKENKTVEEQKQLVDAANALTKNSTNVKNAITYYLEDKNVNIYEEGLFNYLKETFGFGK